MVICDEIRTLASKPVLQPSMAYKKQILDLMSM